MERRTWLKLVTGAGGALVLPPMVRYLTGEPFAAQGIEPLSPAVFDDRLKRAAELTARRGLGALFLEPGTNLEYLSSARPGRSERLIALIVPADAEPVLLVPEFEVARVRRAAPAVPTVLGWAEREDPFRHVADILADVRPRRLGVGPEVRYGMAVRLQEALEGWALADAGPLFERMRIIKSERELALIRRAISITEISIAATFAALETGVTDRVIARHLSDEMRRRGAPGGGLVQFGPTSALPHGGAENRRLERGMPVLIDCGCNVHGYVSDITRMHFFGDDPPPDYREVYNVVYGAQSAAADAGRSGMACERLDGIARRVIESAGYGDRFTHRLGHGLGMDGHEPPYLVEGNERPLEPGMVFTIEPGIYLPGRWGVRIEDDFVVRDGGLEALSSRVAPL